MYLLTNKAMKMWIRKAEIF